MEDINREKILNEIRKEISENGYSSKRVSFFNDLREDDHEPYSEENMREYCNWINQSINIRSQNIGDGSNPVKRVIKKTINEASCRILASSVIKTMKPEIEKQECVNISVYEAISMIEKFMNEKDYEIKKLKDRIKELEDRINKGGIN